MNNHYLSLIIISLLLPFVGYVFYPSLTREILKDLRIPRILHYVSLATLGGALFLKKSGGFPQGDALPLLWLAIIYVFCLTYAAVFAIITNNIADIVADKISNPDRPLVRVAVHPKHYLWAGILCELWALLLAFIVSFPLWIGIFSISLGYFLYSCPPFQLKKIPILAKLIIGINSLCVSVTGFALLGGKISDFPATWAFFILVPLSLAANFVDLKDIEGDKKMGVKTLPVLLGKKKSTIWIALFTCMSYGFAGFLLGKIGLLPLVAGTGILHVYLLFKEPYNEKPIFILYVFGLFGLSFFLFLA